MLEGIPRQEAEYVARYLPRLNKAIGWQRVLLRVLTFNFFGSTITGAGKKGFTFLPGYNAVLKNKKRILSVPTNTTEEVLSAVIETGYNGRYAINLPLETGDFLTPSESDRYILHDRNVRMAANIDAYITSEKFDLPALAMIGANHNPGIANLLKSRGFKKCTNMEEL